MDNNLPSILVVEDDPTLRLLVCKQLEILSLAAEEAVNGEIAIVKFRSNNYALIFMDVMMPVIDGLSTTKAIREIEDTSPDKKRTPIVGMTAYSDKAACLAAGMDDFLFKPVLLDQISNVLQKWLPSGLSAEDRTKPDQSPVETTDSFDGNAQQKLHETGEQLDRIKQRISDLKVRFDLQ
jgi:CheY-like chemotaxis protein